MKVTELYKKLKEENPHLDPEDFIWALKELKKMKLITVHGSGE